MAGCGEHVISMEELLSKKVNVVITEAGETSRGSDNSGLRRRIIEIGEEACELKKKRFEKLRKSASDQLSINTPNGGQKAPPNIQKVPLLLQDHKHFDKYFKPRIVAIGPIHHGVPKYNDAEAYKLRMASDFVKDSGRKDEILYDIVEKNIEQLRQCFDEKVTEKYSDQALAWMLFVDGCAILQSIHCAVSKNCKHWKMKYDQVAFATQDLFLLENQLPYQLLVDLMNSSAKKDEFENSITNFINQQAVYSKSPPSQNGLTTTERPIHLLDLLRTKIMKGNPQSTNGSIKAGDKSKRKKLKKRIQSFLLRDDSKQNGERLKWTYRNVEELRSAGIYMWCNDSDDPLTTIRFKRLLGNFYPGYLWLSPITVDDAMGPKFLNLIAYEMCPDFDNEFEITSYILFLDSLIDNVQDVVELRNKGILKNYLGSDKEVARLFNEIGTDLIPDPDAYGDVKDAIQRHYDATCMNWIADALHEHFRSPWTFLAFSAAIIVLSLTFIQTWFAFKEDRGNSRPRVRR